MRKIILSVSILLSFTFLLKAQESSATKVFEYRPGTRTVHQPLARLRKRR